LNCPPEQTVKSIQIRTEFENLAAAFLRLAEQAERNAAPIIEFNLPPEKAKPKS
jgi:hypothetical protein